MTRSLNNGRRIGHSSITMKCRECNNLVHNVDSESKSVLCYKCVSKSLNPNTKFYGDISQEDIKEIIRSLPSANDQGLELLSDEEV